MALPKLYNLITWHNNTTPALNENNLNAMSQALDDIDDRVIDLAGTIMEDVPQIIEDMAILEPAIENIDENVARAEAAAESAEQYAEEIAPPIEVVKDYADIITVEDAINKAAKDVKVKVDAVQDLHGYDKPWVGGAGKNIFHPDRTQSRTVNGVTYSINDDGTVEVKTASGGATAETTIIIKDFVQGGTVVDSSFNGKTVILNGCPSGGSSSTYFMQFYRYDGSNNVYDYGSGTSAFTINVGTSGYVNMAIIIKAGTTFTTSKIFKPMLRLSTESDATWVPYTNICPITGHSEVNVTRAGKNLYEFPSLDSIKSINTQGTWSGNVYTRNNATFTINEDNKTITINGTPSGNTELYLNSGDMSAYSGLALWGFDLTSDVGRIIIEQVGGSWTNYATQTGGQKAIIATIPASTSQMFIRISSGKTLNNHVVGPMMTAPIVSDGSFQPFEALDVYTIDLDGTRYGGTLDVDAGTLTLTHKYTTISSVVLAGTATTGYSRWRANAPSDAKIVTTTAQVADLKSDKFTAISADDTYNRVNGIALHPSNYVFMYCSEWATKDATAVNTILSADPVQLVYELATPQTITLTAEEVTLLLGYNTLFADTGDIALTYDASGVLRIANAKLDIDTFKSVVAASSDFADFKSRVAAL